MEQHMDYTHGIGPVIRQIKYVIDTNIDVLLSVEFRTFLFINILIRFVLRKRHSVEKEQASK